MGLALPDKESGRARGGSGRGRGGGAASQATVFREIGERWRPGMPTVTDWQVERLLTALRDDGTPSLATLSPARARRGNAMLLRQFALPGPALGEVVDAELETAAGTLRARRYRPAEPALAGRVVYFHGGGWVIGDLEIADWTCRVLAEKVGCEVLSVTYPLAPEQPFPAAVEAAVAAAQWAVDNTDRGVVVAGDSAGGTLAAVCGLRARARPELRLAGQVLVYPLLDHDFETDSYVVHRDMPLCGRREMEWYWDHYVPAAADRDLPDASPLLAPALDGVPPTALLVAERDPVRDEGLAFADRLAAEGVHVRVACCLGACHGFLSFPSELDVAHQALDATAEEIARMLTDGPGGAGDTAAVKPDGGR